MSGTKVLLLDLLLRNSVTRRMLVKPPRDAHKSEHAGTGETFADAYTFNSRSGIESVSGPGSSMKRTRVIRQELPKLFKELGVSSMLDIPCGDFNWLKDVDLDGIHYTGADIVHELVQRNQRHSDNYKSFVRLNILNDPLPGVDLVLLRDCLVHFSYTDIFRALENIYNSGSRYLLTTTFDKHPENQDIVTGQWRVLNLQAAPFDLSPPARLIYEDYPKLKFADKALALWEVKDIKS